MLLKRTVNHPFHIVDPSPWPYQVAFASFQMLFGLTLYMHYFEKGFSIFIFGLIATTLGASLWWRDIVREGTFEGQHTAVVQYGLRFGMVLFIVSEVMLFFRILLSIFP